MAGKDNTQSSAKPEASKFDKEMCWILDTGATDHMVYSTDSLTTNRRVINRTVSLSNGAIAAVTHIGSLHVANFVLHDVLCVPSFKLNLISISKLLYKSNYAATFTDHTCLLQDQRSGKMIGMGTERGGLYYLDTSQRTSCNAAIAPVSSSPKLWHQRLGHLSNKIFHLLSHSVMNIQYCDISDCLICPLAKQTRCSFPLSSIRTKAPFELIHVDIWGGYHVPSITRAQYFLTIVDDYTRCTWTYLMSHKSDAQTYITAFINLVETQFSLKIKILRSDNGPEFTLKNLYLDKGIIHQTSCVSTPQQNGVAERKHRHLLNVARALLFQANLPKKFWGDAILTATYLINRIPTPLLQGKSPFEALFRKQPTYDHLRVFGCLYFVSTHNHRPTKFDARATQCIFLGYPYNQKWYRVYDLLTGKIFTSRDVIFFEEIFPFSSSAASSPLIPHPSPIYDYDSPTLETFSPDSPSQGENSLANTETTLKNNPSATASSPLIDQSTSLLPSIPQTTPPRLTRTTKPPKHLNEYQVGISLPSRNISTSNSALVTAAGITYPLSTFLSYDRLSSKHKAFTTSLSVEKEPSSFAEAVCDPKWRLAM